MFSHSGRIILTVPKFAAFLFLVFLAKAISVLFSLLCAVLGTVMLTVNWRN